jgi:hypothetical protein
MYSSNINKFINIQSNQNLKSIIDYIIIRKNNDVKINDMRGIECYTDYYLFRSKIFLPYRYNARINEEEARQNTEKSKNIKYKVENLMQDSIKY